MSAVPESRLSLEEYLSRERVAEYKSEFYQGEIFAMTGGSPTHNDISVNIVAALKNSLRGRGCRPSASDQRIRIPANGLCTYPDASVVCGDREFDDIDTDAITNPVVIFEVLSKSTERYDRGKKFDLYRELHSLREYVLVSQNEAQVERFVRQDDGNWLLTVLKGPEAILKFASFEVSLTLSEIYEDVDFQPEESESLQDSSS
ncbi:MAG: Uma2 family endonuclease [Rhodopirellula sp.]|nr:Uma2 family endonuclease [Rhodopirellula sp.]